MGREAGAEKLSGTESPPASCVPVRVKTYVAVPVPPVLDEDHPALMPVGAPKVRLAPVIVYVTVNDVVAPSPVLAMVDATSNDRLLPVPVTVPETPDAETDGVPEPAKAGAAVARVIAGTAQAA